VGELVGEGDSTPVGEAVVVGSAEVGTAVGVGLETPVASGGAPVSELAADG
jgi:hypothetical protein